MVVRVVEVEGTGSAAGGGLVPAGAGELRLRSTTNSRPNIESERDDVNMLVREEFRSTDGRALPRYSRKLSGAPAGCDDRDENGFGSSLVRSRWSTVRNERIDSLSGWNADDADAMGDRSRVGESWVLSKKEPLF